MSDMDVVSNAASVLEISDFEFWKLASQRVHFDFPNRTIEHMFGHYIMGHTDMPPFVRKFAEDILSVSVDDAHLLLATDGAYFIA